MCHGPQRVPMGETTRLPPNCYEWGRIVTSGGQRRGPSTALALSPFPGDTGAAASETRRLIAAPPRKAPQCLPAGRGRPVWRSSARAGRGDDDSSRTDTWWADLGQRGRDVGRDPPEAGRASGTTRLHRSGRTRSWRLDARPVPVTLDVAAQAARSEELSRTTDRCGRSAPAGARRRDLGRAGCWSSAHRTVRWRVRLDHPSS